MSQLSATVSDFTTCLPHCVPKVVPEPGAKRFANLQVLGVKYLALPKLAKAESKGSSEVHY